MTVSFLVAQDILQRDEYLAEEKATDGSDTNDSCKD